MRNVPIPSDDGFLAEITFYEASSLAPVDDTL
jgi:hypothetical protein